MLNATRNIKFYVNLRNLWYVTTAAKLLSTVTIKECTFTVLF